MRRVSEVGLIGAGYIGAFAIASAVVSVYVAGTSSPDRQSYGVMFAFGDTLLFLAVFGVAAVVPTGAALFGHLASHGPDAYSVANAWSAVAVLRILIAPLFALASLVSAVIAPSRRPRLALLAATAIEASVFVSIAFIWFHPFGSH